MEPKYTTGCFMMRMYVSRQLRLDVFCVGVFTVESEYWASLEPYSHNSTVSHDIRALLMVCPSKHLILDSQENLMKTVTLVTLVLHYQ